MRAPLLLAALLVAPAYADEAPTPVQLSLKEILRRAHDNNPAIDVARAQLDDYQALFDRAYYAWVPRLSVDALLAPLPERRLLKECVLDEIYVDPDGNELTRIGPCPGDQPADDEQLDADTEIGLLLRTSAKLTFPIYTFGKVSSGQEAARAGIEVGRAGVDVARSRIDMLIKKAWYGLQLADASLDVLKDGRKRMRKAIRAVEKELKKESGRFTSNDLRKLQVDQADLVGLLLETRALRKVAYEGLRVAAGLKPGTPYEQTDKRIRPVAIEPRTEAEYLELASSARPEMRALQAAVRARAAQVDMAVADLYPDIALVGVFTYSLGTTADDNPDPFADDRYNTLSWGVVLGANWRFDFSTRLSAIERAEADLRKQRATRDSLAQKVELEIAEHYGNVQRYAETLTVREQAAKAAKGWLVSNTLNFGLGLVSTDELLKSLVAYNRARLKNDQTIYEYNLAVARLSRTVGVELALPARPDE